MKEQPNDMEELMSQLKLRRIPYVQNEHPLWREAQSLPDEFVISKNLVDQWQIFVNSFSIIRIMTVMHGNAKMFEVFRADIDGPERFMSVDEVIKYVDPSWNEDL